MILKKNKAITYNLNCTIDRRQLPDEQPVPAFIIYLIEAGSGIIEINSQGYPLMAPLCLCLNESEQLKIEAQHDILFSTIWFHPNIINSEFTFENIRGDVRKTFSGTGVLDHYWLKPFIERAGHSCGILNTGPVSAEIIKGHIAKLHTNLEQKADRYWPCRGRSYLFDILNILLHLFESPYKNEDITLFDIDDDIKAVINYITANYNQKVTIPVLSQFFSINKTTLSEKFIKATGVTIIAYLTRLRVHMACMLLKDTTLPVYEIMYRVGYEDTSHFGRVFKKQTSVSPSQYREQSKKPSS